MAEKMMLVCDVCGKPAAKSVTLRVDSTNRVKDFCEQHLAELLGGAPPPRRGRPVGSSRKKAARKRTSRKRRATQKR
jgi:hypothetical protein